MFKSEKRARTNAIIKKPRKKHKTSIPIKSIPPNNICSILSKKIIYRVLDFCDFKAYFVTLPRVNSFFYHAARVHLRKLPHCRININVKLLEVPKGFFISKIKKSSIRLIKRIKNLKKLTICMKFDGDSDMSLYKTPLNEIKLYRTLESFNLSRTIKCLDIFLISLNSSSLKSFLKAFHYLESAKFHIVQYSSISLNSIFSHFLTFEDKMKKNQTDTSIPSTLKVLSFEFLHKTKTIFKENSLESLDHNNTLRHFSMKFPRGVHIHSELSPLAVNKTLKYLKLPNFQFSVEVAQLFCNFLIANHILEHLSCSDTLAMALQSLVQALQINKSLKAVVLHYMPSSGYTLGPDEIIGILKVSSNLSKLKFYSEYAPIYTHFADLAPSSDPCFIENDVSEKIIRSIQDLLKISTNLKKFTIEIKYLSAKYVGRLSEEILKSAQNGGIEYFDGYNLKRMIEDKVQEFFIKKKHYKIDYTKCKNLLYGMLSLIVPNMKNITKLSHERKMLTFNGSEGFVTDLKQIINTTFVNKTLKFENSRGSLHDFIVLSFATQFSSLEILDLSKVSIFPYILTFPKILKNFPSLKFIYFKTNSLPKLFEFAVHDIFVSAATFLKNLEAISANIPAVVSQFNKIFKTFSRHRNLKKIELLNVKMITIRSIATEQSLKDFFLISKIQHLRFFHCYFTVNRFSQLIDIITINPVFSNIEIENILFEMEPWEKVYNQEEYKWKSILKSYFLFLTALKTKTNYLTISLSFKETPPSSFPILPQIVEEFYGEALNVLRANKDLEIFNVLFPIPQENLMKYSNLILSFVKNSHKIRVLNYYPVRDIINAENPKIETRKHFEEMNEVLNCGLNISKQDSNESEERYGYVSKVPSMMPIILSELIKEKKDFVIDACACTRSITKTDLEGPKLNFSSLTNLHNFPDPSELTLILNLLSSCQNLEKITLPNLYLFRIDMQILLLNLPKLPNLKSIKLINLRYKIIDYALFLTPPNIKSISISCDNLQITNFTNFSIALKEKPLEKLSFKAEQGVSGETLADFLKKISSPTVKKLKLKFPLSPNDVNLFIKSVTLRFFPSLEILKLDISSADYADVLDNLIILLLNPNFALKCLELSSFVWYLQSFDRSTSDLSLKNKKLKPIDLVFLAKIIELKFFSALKNVDFSDNLIIGENSIGFLIRVIENFKLCSLNVVNTGMSGLKPENLLGFFKALRNNVESLIVEDGLNENQLDMIRQGILANPKIGKVVLRNGVSDVRVISRENNI